MGRPQLKIKLGEKIGFWEVIDNNNVVRNGHSYVKVKCTRCGHTCEKTVSDLRRRNSLVCKQCVGMYQKIPINIGDQFNDWTVISDGIKGIRKHTVVYKCRCKCGTEAYVSSYELRSGKSSKCRQCGANRRKQQYLAQTSVGELQIHKFLKIQQVASRRSIIIELTMQYLWDLYIKQNKQCAITGDYLADINKASLDRIDSSKGYVIGNVQWVTKQANLSKHIMSMEQLLEFCKKVINHANQQPSTGLTTCEGSETNF